MKKYTRQNRNSRPKKKRTLRKRKGGDNKNVGAHFIFEKMHTSPNIRARVFVKNKPKMPTNIIDFGALSKMINHYVQEVNEQISIIKEGDKKDKKMVKTINFYMDNAQIPIFQ